VAAPTPAVEIEDGPDLRGERRVAWKQSAAVAPRATRVPLQPSPQRGAPEGRHEPAPDRLSLPMRCAL
jgi:hypothetical protein